MRAGARGAAQRLSGAAGRTAGRVGLRPVLKAGAGGLSLLCLTLAAASAPVSVAAAGAPVGHATSVAERDPDRPDPVLDPADVLPAGVAPGGATVAGLPGDVPASAVTAVSAQALSASGIPALVLKAYQAAERREHVTDPSCGLTWPVLAGIGRVESDHARDVPAGGGITADGTVLPPILGPVLDGSSGTAAISDVPAGSPAGTVSWARAIGPMQFLSSTWRLVGVDGNGDGKADPDNVFDASLAAARYLCSGHRVLTDPTQLAAAVFSYNHSDDYVRLVLQLTAQYAQTDPAALLRGAGLATVPAPTTAPATTPATATPVTPVRTPAAPVTPPRTTPPATPPSSPPPPTPTPVAQTITFPQLAAQTFPGTGPALQATGGRSGAPVTFTAGPAAVCSVSGTRLVLAGPGACTVTASQAGAAGYLPAPPVSQTVPVGYLVTAVQPLSGAAGTPLRVVVQVAGEPPGSPLTLVAADVDGAALAGTPASRTFAASPTSAAAGRWAWQLPTTGLAAGAHVLHVTVAGDPTPHAVAFTLS